MPYLFLFILLFSSGAYSASGYQPVGKVTNGATSATVRTLMNKIGFAPYDAFMAVYPAVANGAKIGASSVGAVASSVYSGSAAVAARMTVPVLNGAGLAIDMVANIPKANMVSSAVSILKNPYLGVALVAGTALYTWLDSAGLKNISPGYLGAIPPFVLNTFNEYWVSNALHSTDQVTACQAFLTSNAPGYVYHHVDFDGINYNCYGKYQSFAPTKWIMSVGLSCVSGYTLISGSCHLNDPDPPVSPISDSDAISRLNSAPNPSSPSDVLIQIIDNGLSPDVDLPVLSVDPVIPIAVTNTVNPDGSKLVEASEIHNTVSGDTVTSEMVTTKTTKDAEDNVIGVTTRTEAAPLVPSANTVAIDTPINESTESPIPALNSISKAIDDASAQSHDDSLVAQAAAAQVREDLLAQPVQIANELIDTLPAAAPVAAPFAPDPLMEWLPISNPFSWNPSDYLPALPSSSCGYEIHGSFNVPFLGMKSFDVAPCAKLEPLRTLMGWVFAVLTAWTCFVVIFKSSS
jgi:hypothetical protein